MQRTAASQAYRKLEMAERERLFLDILSTPRFEDSSGWGARFHGWLEEQAAEGRPLGEIARRIDLPSSDDVGHRDAWQLLDDHVTWMLEASHARVVRIEVVA